MNQESILALLTLTVLSPGARVSSAYIKMTQIKLRHVNGRKIINVTSTPVVPVYLENANGNKL